MIRSATFPGRYVQGPGALARLGQEGARLGSHVIVLADANLPADVVNAIGRDGVEVTVRHVPPSCTPAAVEAARAAAVESGADVVAGMGGGKVIDLARAAADDLNLPFICLPTIAASDAPCSALSVIYDEDGHVLHDRFVRFNPRAVIVDSAVIARAPARLFAAGIGDALATFYEADACFRAGAKNFSSGRQTRLAMAVAATCRDTILELGATALEACRKGEPNEAFEAVLEANILLSGIGFESGGVAAAHAIHHGLAELPETHHFLHGEKVAFGVLVELALNGASDEELKQMADFNRTVGLPTCLADLGVTDMEAALPAVITRATRPGEIIYNEPVRITAAFVETAIRRADAVGRKVREDLSTQR